MLVFINVQNYDPTILFILMIYNLGYMKYIFIFYWPLLQNLFQERIDYCTESLV